MQHWGLTPFLHGAGGTRWCTRSTRARSRTPTATASATCPGSLARIDHLAELGVDAIWLSPFYPSPFADGGYDVSDFTDVDPRLGTVADVRALADAAHARGIALLLDLVPCHTSIEHPWFREHPDRYVWADSRPNNWRAAFGGPAWTRDAATGRWYLHSFFPEQPDLDWRNPGGRRGDAGRHPVLARPGRRRVPPRRHRPPGEAPRPGSTTPRGPSRSRSRSRPTWPRSTAATRATGHPASPLRSRALREAAGDAFLVGEVYRPTAELGPYLEHLDTAFVFELMFAPWRADALGAVIERGAGLGRASWMLSNHDFSRVGSRIGEGAMRVAAMLLLTLPGAAFIYQGDEIGLARRAGRRSARGPLRPRPRPPPDAVERRSGRGLHDRRRLAPAGRPRGAERR